jgi:hypothetical protein
MEIHILRDGKQIGPFTEETVQSLLKQGNILINDLAWSPGLTGWSPLHAVLYPAAQPPPAPENAVPPPMPPSPTPPAALSQPVEESPVIASQTEATTEPAAEGLATDRQKAFLTFMAVPFSSNLSKDRAAQLVKDAMDNPKNSGRLKRWEGERLRLYPDLFSDEIKTRRENRAQQYFEICQGEGAEFFDGVTKAHTQVLVGYLDVQYPTWDQTEHSAKYNYFFSAIAEKFPQLVKRSAKGRFKYPDGPKVAAEIVRGPVAVRGKARKSPVKAAVRGIVWGGVLLVIALTAVEVQRRGGINAIKALIAKASERAKSAPQKAVAAKPVTVAELKTTITTTPAPIPVQPSETVAKPPSATTVAQTPTFPTATPPATTLRETPAPATTPSANPTMAANTAPASSLPANISLFDTTPPPAVPPANESLVPTAATAAPAAAPQRGYAKITKPTVISLRFGTSTLRPGTPVQVLSASGSSLTIKFGPETATIPTANTDYSGTLSMVPAPTQP